MSRCAVNYIADLAMAVGGSPAVLNPVKGCTPYGPGCAWCWAAAMLDRFGRHPGLTRRTKTGPVFTGELAIDAGAVDQVQSWRKLRVVFLNDLGDVMHDKVPAEALAKIFRVILANPLHLFVIPTHRMAEAPLRLTRMQGTLRQMGATLTDDVWPPRNVILLSSQEDGRQAAAKLPAGQALYAAGWQVGVSYEPALGPGGVEGWDFARWVVLGSLSGVSDPPFSAVAFEDLARQTRDWCARRSIPFYLKQAPHPLLRRRIVRNPELDGVVHRGLWQPQLTNTAGGK